MKRGLLAPQLASLYLVTYPTGTSVNSLQTQARASLAHTTARQLSCFVLSLKSDGPITGPEGQVWWPRGSSGWLRVLPMVPGVWQQRRAGCVPRPQSRTKGSLIKAPEATWPLSPCCLQGPGLYRSAPSPVISLQAPALLRAWPPSGLGTHRGAQVASPAPLQPPAAQPHTRTYSVLRWPKVHSRLQRDLSQTNSDRTTLPGHGPRF